MTMAGNSVGWNVTDQQEGMDLSSSGTVVRGMRIYFATTNGHKSSIFVPAAQYMNTDYVREQLAIAAAAVAAVGNLTG